MPDPLLTQFALGLAGHVAEALSDASARVVRRKFEGDEQQKALKAALLSAHFPSPQTKR